MRDIVICPSYYRAEFLALVLEHLAGAEGAREKEVWVAQDRHTFDTPDLTKRLPDIREVCRRFQTGAFRTLRYIERQLHSFRANPFNFLEAYKEAYNTNARYVYLVEDDVIVTKDFFRWHEAVQEKLWPFVSVGWHNIRDTAKVPPTTDPHAYVTSYRDFSSIGVCWRRENLEALVAHARSGYYQNMTGYLEKAFPGSPISPRTWTEQAGVITRLLHEKPGERLVVWSGPPRVGHIGIQGYHRLHGHRWTGTLDQRIQALREVYLDTDALLKLHNSRWDDINAVKEVGPWDPEKLYCHQHNEYVKGIV